VADAAAASATSQGGILSVWLQTLHLGCSDDSSVGFGGSGFSIRISQTKKRVRKQETKTLLML
jgi:hypothetical protein